jgi:multicomponent Na+:H+ antiporter subunit G
MSDLLASVAVVLGVTLALLSAVGIVRMPDVYTRLQVATKASSLGVGLIMLGVAVHFGDLGVTVRALLVVAFIFLTAPVSAHLIGRAAYIAGVPLARGTNPDELAGEYDRRSGRLASPPGFRDGAPDAHPAEGGAEGEP